MRGASEQPAEIWESEGEARRIKPDHGTHFLERDERSGMQGAGRDRRDGAADYGGNGLILPDPL